MTPNHTTPGGSAPPGKPRFVRFFITEDEFDVFNFLRYKHDPATMPAWANDALRRAALAELRERIKAGKPVPPGVVQAADAISRREKLDGFKSSKI